MMCEGMSSITMAHHGSVLITILNNKSKVCLPFSNSSWKWFTLHQSKVAGKLAMKIPFLRHGGDPYHTAGFFLNLHWSSRHLAEIACGTSQVCELITSITGPCFPWGNDLLPWWVLTTSGERSLTTLTQLSCGKMVNGYVLMLMTFQEYVGNMLV